MKKKVKVCFVGGGSIGWGPRLVCDLMGIKEIEHIELCLLDPNIKAATKIAKYGEKIAKDWGRKATFEVTADQEQGFKGADFILICINTGGQKAAAHDLEIPAKYGIYQTVSDTCGPGGWSCAIRNIPVFEKIARDAKRICPNAVILNYSNPMAALTGTLVGNTDQPVVGLCHGIFGVLEFLRDMFKLKDYYKEISFNSGGVNHFFWFMDLKINGKDGLKMIRRKLNGRDFDTYIKEELSDTKWPEDVFNISQELMDQYGYLPYTGDRHTAEFFSCYLAPTKKRAKESRLYDKHHNRLKDNQDFYKCVGKEFTQIMAGKKEIEREGSREIAKDIIRTISTNGEIIDVLNLPNQGQMPDLPMGAILETRGIINSLGFTPLSVGPIPQELVNTLLPHTINQLWITEAGAAGDKELFFKALINDPICSHLTIKQVRAMGEELLLAQKKHLPRFFKKKGKGRK